MKLRIQADNLTELVGGGLLIAGIAVLVGLGAALLAGAAVAIALAEFSWAGKVWSLPLPTRRQKNVMPGLIRRQLKNNYAETEARRADVFGPDVPLKD